MKEIMPYLIVFGITGAFMLFKFLIFREDENENNKDENQEDK